MSSSRMIVGLIIVFYGLSLLFNIHIWPILGPLILIIIGLKIMSKSEGKFNVQSNSKTNQNSIDETVVFSSVTRVIESDNFEGGKFTTVFGEGKLDLTKVKTEAKVIEMEITTIFGEARVAVPKNWKIKSEGVGVLGSFENNSQNQGKDTVTLKVKGTAVFGRTEISTKVYF